MPARSDQAARHRARRLLVDMKGLGIEFAREGDDVRGGHGGIAVFDDFVGRKILEGKFVGHGPQLAKRKCSTSPSATA